VKVYPTFERYVEGVQEEVAAEVFRRIVDRTPIGPDKDGHTHAFERWELEGIQGGHRISNAAPYINRLEHGWSSQAPAGMVAVTLMEINDIADEIKRNSK
jgi:hypothetical protein